MTTPTTPDLRTMLDAATPGPWATQHDEWENDESIPCEVFSVIAGGDAILETTNFDPATHNPTANTILAAAAPGLAKEVLVWRKGVLNLIRSFESVSNTAFNSNDPDVGTAYYTAAANLRALTEELLGDQA